MTTQPKRRRISGIAFFIVALLALFWALLGLPVLLTAYNNDFLCYYIGGTLAREGRFADLYQPSAHWEIQRRVAPGLKEPRPFPRPPWFALALAPLTRLPLLEAYVLWVAAWFAVLLATWSWGAARFGEGALLLAALFLPTNIGLCYGQDCVAMLAICCCAWILFERKRMFASGLALGLGLMKFHLLLFVPVWLIAQKRWRMLAGFAAVACVFAVAAFSALGVSGLEQYVHFLRFGHTELFDHSPETMINVNSVLENFGIHSTIAGALAAAAVIGVSLFGILRAPAWRGFSIALTASLLICPHVFGYDAAMLLLPVWLVIENSRSKFSRWSALSLANPVTFYLTALRSPWSAIPAVALLVFLGALIADPSEAVRREAQAAPADTALKSLPVVAAP